MARTVAELLAQMEKFLPEDYDTARPLFVAAPAAMAEAEADGELKAAQIPIGSASGNLLTLLARGYGLRRGDNETDDQLRARMRAIEDRITRPAIIAAVESIDPLLLGNVEMIEWFDEGFLDTDAFLDSTPMSSGPRSFVLIVPALWQYHAAGSFLDADAFLDTSAYVGSAEEDPIYNAIVAAVEERRGAGIRWALRIES